MRIEQISGIVDLEEMQRNNGCARLALSETGNAMKTAPYADMLRLVNGYQVSQAIYVATGLWRRRPSAQYLSNIEELASLTASHPGGLYRLLRALAAIGVFHESEKQDVFAYGDGECLRSNSPTPLGAWAAYVGRSYVWQTGEETPRSHSVRTGEGAFEALHKQSVWDFRAANREGSRPSLIGR